MKREDLERTLQIKENAQIFQHFVYTDQDTIAGKTPVHPEREAWIRESIRP